MRRLLQELRELQKLKDIALEQQGRINTSQLEQDFVRFSSYSPKAALKVQLPKLYTIQGEEKTHIQQALVALGLQKENAPPIFPKALDIAGEFEYHPSKEALLFVSPTQFRADHYSSVRSYLNPLVENIYSEKIALLRDFTKQEAVIGLIERKRANLNLEQIALYPHLFTSGPYELRVKLDTPTKMISAFCSLQQKIKELEQNPKQTMLQPKVVEKTTATALHLRNILGNLSRYEQPESQECIVATNSCIVRTTASTLFYLYAEKIQKNILVYFGEDPFTKKEKPSQLEVLAGEGQAETLHQLIKAGIYNVSLPLLQQRIREITQLYDVGKQNFPHESDHTDFNELLTKLTTIESYFQAVINPAARLKYIEKIDHELGQFMVCPASEDIVTYQLLPRLSWNESVRMYHQTLTFITKFQQAQELEKRAMLHKVISNMAFDSQQNKDVNVWLYQNHKSLCQEENILFEVI